MIERQSHAARFAKTLEGAWRTVRSVSVGGATSDAEAYVLVTRNGEPLLTIALHEQSGPFRDAAVWAGNVVVGHGAALHLVSLATFSVTSHALDAYFGHLYVFDGTLLVADSRSLWRFNANGSIAWRSQPLAVDGVVVFEIEDGEVHGEGEHDPPGGWRPYRLSFATGELLD